jgi:hypothetical protein
MRRREVYPRAASDKHPTLGPDGPGIAQINTGLDRQARRIEKLTKRARGWKGLEEWPEYELDQFEISPDIEEAGDM